LIAEIFVQLYIGGFPVTLNNMFKRQAELGVMVIKQLFFTRAS